MKISTQTIIEVTSDAGTEHKIPYNQRLEYLWQLISDSSRMHLVQKVFLIKMARATNSKCNLAEYKALVEDALRARPTPFTDLLK